MTLDLIIRDIVLISKGKKEKKGGREGGKEEQCSGDCVCVCVCVRSHRTTYDLSHALCLSVQADALSSYLEGPLTQVTCS